MGCGGSCGGHCSCGSSGGGTGGSSGPPIEDPEKPGKNVDAPWYDHDQVHRSFI